MLKAEHPDQPIYEMSVENCRRLDELATTDFGIPSIVLMENAAIGLCQHAQEMLEAARSQKIVIYTGPGNNAGDGFALARHLHALGYPLTVVLATPANAIQGDAKTNLDIIQRMEIEIISAEDYLQSNPKAPGLIVDALFGTGLTRAICGVAEELVQHMNACKKAGALILAVDVPSGLNAQTGMPMGDAVIFADRTVTLAALKDGFNLIEAQPILGDLFIAPIGIPSSLLESFGREVQHPQDRP